MSFESSTKVAYNEEEFEVSGTVFVDIEDNCEAIDKLVGVSEGEKDAAKEWIVYKALIDSGLFVSKPSVPEPQLVKVFTEPQTTLEELPFYEPEKVWTQEKILAEREKLIKREEALLKKERAAVEALQQRQIVAPPQAEKPARATFYHPDGTPYTNGQYWQAWGMLLFIIVILFTILGMCAYSR
jgi:hypothetical protein